MTFRSARHLVFALISEASASKKTKDTRFIRYGIIDWQQEDRVTCKFRIE